MASCPIPTLGLRAGGSGFFIPPQTNEEIVMNRIIMSMKLRTVSTAPHTFWLQY